MPRHHHDTIAALATSVGTAALAVVRASGPDTPRLLTEIFGAAPLPRCAKHADYRDRAGALLDDVLVTFFPGPRSYTGDDVLEISGHGNPFIAQKILEDLFARGCRPAEPGEFTQRAFLNGRMDLSQAEAVMDLIHARSERALNAANQQLRGAIGRKMNELVERLLGVLARIEAYIDFPDEDLPTEDRGIVERELKWLRQETERLVATSRYGELLRDGIKTVIVGEPNVGKSSLLNRLVGKERALVSPEPGTTRDFIEERIIVGAHSLRLIDTAGLNPSPAPLEKLGMEKTRERLEEADLILAVADGSSPNPRWPAELDDPPRNVIKILNKSDLGNLHPDVSPHGLTDVVRLSALTGSGVDDLVRAIERRADAFQVHIGEDLIAINARHARTLDEACFLLRRVCANLEDAQAPELVAAELRALLAAYGEIIGKIDNESMLDRLFKTFCIGK